MVVYYTGKRLRADSISVHIRNLIDFLYKISRMLTFLFFFFYCTSDRKENLGISSFGVSVTTMEEVFIRVASGTDEFLLQESRYCNNYREIIIVHILHYYLLDFYDSYLTEIDLNLLYILNQANPLQLKPHFLMMVKMKVISIVSIYTFIHLSIHAWTNSSICPFIIFIDGEVQTVEVVFENEEAEYPTPTATPVSRSGQVGRPSILQMIEEGSAEVKIHDNGTNYYGMCKNNSLKCPQHIRIWKLSLQYSDIHISIEDCL